MVGSSMAMCSLARMITLLMLTQDQPSSAQALTVDNILLTPDGGRGESDISVLLKIHHVSHPPRHEQLIGLGSISIEHYPGYVFPHGSSAFCQWIILFWFTLRLFLLFFFRLFSHFLNSHFFLLFSVSRLNGLNLCSDFLKEGKIQTLDKMSMFHVTSKIFTLMDHLFSPLCSIMNTVSVGCNCSVSIVSIFCRNCSLCTISSFLGSVSVLGSKLSHLIIFIFLQLGIISLLFTSLFCFSFVHPPRSHGRSFTS